MYPTYSAIFTLHSYAVPSQIFYNPTFDKGLLWILNPNIALAREVVLSLDPTDGIGAPSHVLRFDEGGSKSP